MVPEGHAAFLLLAKNGSFLLILSCNQPEFNRREGPYIGMSSKLNNEDVLLAGIAEADGKAFETIVHHYYPRLLPFTANLTKNRHVAEEIVQEVFLRLWQQRHDTARIYHLSSWLFTIASNLSLTYLKRKAVEGRLLQLLRDRQPDRTLNTEEQVYWKESGLLLREAVLRLPPQQKLVYELSRHEGLSTREIANRLQLSPNTVKNHLVKALQTIRDFVRRSTGLYFF
ncbi:RNA polymerase sigma-70 factor [Chitinophaga lutea]|uniref:RNA polymerase sigma-70 factor n=2 Tax=Chitinophaga lutea TaxID=2488634 RepID=A0A3N4Q9K1_9BACT|nr:RNA polymerase sigma-70 factor [Chitinophaga lutea]